MKARFMALEDGNEVIQFTFQDDYNDMTVLEPDKVWRYGTYGLVVCERQSKCELITSVVRRLDIGTGSIGAPVVDGLACHLSDLPEEFCNFTDLDQICKDRYGELARSWMAPKLTSFLSAAESPLDGDSDEIAIIASPYLMDQVYGILRSEPKVPLLFSDAARGIADWPNNSWLDDDVLDSCLVYCDYFDHAELLKRCMKMLFHPLPDE